MDKLKLLQEIIDDYLDHMDGINERRLEIYKKDYQAVQEECKLTNLLANNIRLYKEKYGISKD